MLYIISMYFELINNLQTLVKSSIYANDYVKIAEEGEI